MKYNNRNAFTLVELIVVITILAILATIAFVSFAGYTLSARESTRLNDIKLIEKKLSYYQVENNNFPLPDNYVTLTASGTTIGYQGEVGTGVLTAIRQAGDIVDPLDSSRYSYYLLQDRINFQMLALMEDDGSLRTSTITPTYANTLRYPMTFGKKLGILLDESNIPVQDTLGGGSLDITQTSTGYTAYLSDNETFTGTGFNIRQVVPRSSCKRLHDLGEAASDGNYTIYPIGEEPTEVYCNMSQEDGGLTLIARSVDNTDFNGVDFGWFVQTGSINNESRPYSLGDAVQDIPFDKIYLGVYQNGKSFSGGVTVLDVTDMDLFDGSYTNTAIPIPAEDCVGVPMTILVGGVNPFPLPSSCAAFGYWGNFGSTNSYFLSPQSTPNSDGLNPRRYGATFPYEGVIYVK